MKHFINKLKNNKNVEYILVSLLLILVSIIFASKLGILSSGYHFADDHKIIEINYSIQSVGLFNTLIKYVSDDLVWRFRPLYFIVRVFRTLIFGTNLYMWHLCLAIECGIYMSLSYILARQMKTPIIPSLVFSFIFLIGSQDEIVWRLGPQESLGMVFFILSFILINIYHKNNKKVYCVLSLITIAMMSLYKESFLLLIPSFILFLFYLYLKDDSSNNSIIINFKMFLIKYKILISVSILIFIVSILIVFLFVGLNEPGYAGIDTSYSLGEYIRITLNVFLRDLKDYWIVFGVVIIQIILLIINRKNSNELNQKFWMSFIVCSLSIIYSFGIQMVLYAKSAMFDRYKLPFVWILFFTVIVLLNKSVKAKYLSTLAIVLCVFSFFIYNQNGKSIFQDAKYYAKDGVNVTEMLHYVGSKNNINDGLIVLTDFSWYEHNLSSSIYLQLEENVENIYYCDSEEETGEYKKIFNENDTRTSIENADIILVDSKSIENYDLDKYEIIDFFKYYALEKK